MTNYQFHSGAREDFAKGYDWYLAQNEQAAVRFEQAVQDGIHQILERPDSWPRCDDQHRYFILKKFPFKIVYRNQNDQVIIVAVAHGKRREDYWKDRV